jgi:hypothetical protein
VAIHYDGDLQFGRFDVAAEVLNAPGQRLELFIGAPAAAVIDDLDGPPPADGWRLIAGDLNSPVENQPVLAAPWDNPRGGDWMVISLWQLDGTWHATLNSGRQKIRPSRATRRRGLELAWPASADGKTAHLLADTRLDDIAVTLRNNAPEPWVNDYRDYNGISISVTDDQGRPVTNRHRGGDWGFHAYHHELLPSIEPGAELALTAHFETATTHHGLQPGRYTLTANMHSLGLGTQPRSVTVARPPDAPA